MSNQQKEPAQITINSNTITGLLVVLLIGASFAIGSLWTKVQQQDSGTKVNNTVEGPAGIDLKQLAIDAGADGNDFEKCLSSKETAQDVKDDEKTGRDSGVTGTPGNIIVDTQTGQSLLIAGAAPFESFKEVIDTAKETGELSDTTGYGQEVTELQGLQDGDHVRGNKDARFLLVEYSDYSCPFCARFHPTAQQLVEEFDGELAWVYRHFPLDQLHPTARSEAEASECVAKLAGEDAFWSFTDALYGAK
jgi:protein-disulfide isomerase